MDETARIACAIAHEVGNHLGAVRIQAHLIDEDLDARSLAESSVAIDQLASRAGPLLALLRPLLSADAGSGGPLTDALDSLERRVRQEGARGVRFACEAKGGSAARAPEWMHSALVALADATIAEIGSGQTLRVELEARVGEARLRFSDDGEETDLSTEAAMRGRTLAVSIWRCLIARHGGRVETGREDGWTTVEIVLPEDD